VRVWQVGGALGAGLGKHNEQVTRIDSEGVLSRAGGRLLMCVVGQHSWAVHDCGTQRLWRVGKACRGGGRRG
jgi:hypothetical protein